MKKQCDNMPVMDEWWEKIIPKRKSEIMLCDELPRILQRKSFCLELCQTIANAFISLVLTCWAHIMRTHLNMRELVSMRIYVLFVTRSKLWWNFLDMKRFRRRPMQMDIRRMLLRNTSKSLLFVPCNRLEFGVLAFDCV